MERETRKQEVGGSVEEPAVGVDAVTREDVAESVKAISSEDKKAVVTAAIESVPEDVKREVALRAVTALSPETQEEVLARLQRLPREDREQIAGLLVPDQPVTNRIWTIIVGAFALVFVLSAVALFVVALQTGEIQTLLTVVTTVAGILAGFISGRASSSGT